MEDETSKSLPNNPQYQNNEYVDKLTLELLLNKNHYSKYLSKTDPKKYEDFREYKSKLRKYSVDIIDMTSQLIENPKSGKTTEIQESFNAYMNSILKYYELKEVEKANEYNENTYKNEEEEDVLFGNCDSDSEKDETTPVMKSFWGKERVVKKTTKLSAFDLGMFPQKNF